MCFSCKCEEIVEELATLEDNPTQQSFGPHGEYKLLQDYFDLGEKARELITPNHGDSDVVPQSKNPS